MVSSSGREGGGGERVFRVKVHHYQYPHYGSVLWDRAGGSNNLPRGGLAPRGVGYRPARDPR